MKKLVVIFIVLLLLAFSSCSDNNRPNNNRPDTLKGIHIVSCEKDVRIQDSVYLTNSGINVKLENGEKAFFSNGTYIMFSGKCPICGADMRGGQDAEDLTDEINELIGEGFVI